MDKLKKFLFNYWPLLLILAVTGFMLLFRLGRDSFWDWDECIYASYAKTMKVAGNWLTNQWNGSPALEKPPGYMWIMQIPFSTTINEFSARLPSVIAALALLAAVYVFSKKYFSKHVAILSTLIMLAANLLVVYFIRVNTDIVFTLLIFLGFYFWIKSLSKNNASYWAGLFFGASVMMKGLSVVPFLVAIFISIFIDFNKTKLVNFLKLIGILLLAIAPWHIYEYLTYGQRFIQVYFVENLIQKINNPVEFHFGGRLFYLTLISKDFLPWIFALAILPLFYLINIKKFLTLKSFTQEIKRQQLLLTVILMIILPLISITRAATKISWYAIPLYPFIAIYLACSIDLLLKQINNKKFSRILYYCFVLFIAIFAFKVIYTETQFIRSQANISPRNEIAMISKNYSRGTLDYLVQFSERRARETLAPNLYTSTTFVYGGNSCAVYYSHKKINYYYSTNNFVQRVNQGKGLYLVENGDLHFVQNLPIKTLYHNSDFTLFEN